MAKKPSQRVELRQPDGKHQTSIVKWYNYTYGAPQEEPAPEEPEEGSEGFALPPSPQNYVDEMIRRREGK